MRGIFNSRLLTEPIGKPYQLSTGRLQLLANKVCRRWAIPTHPDLDLVKGVTTLAALS